HADEETQGVRGIPCNSEESAKQKSYERPEERKRTDHTVLLGDDGENEVVVRRRQEVPLHALAGSDAGQPAHREGNARLLGLIAFRLRIKDLLGVRMRKDLCAQVR